MLLPYDTEIVTGLKITVPQICRCRRGLREPVWELVQDRRQSNEV